MLYIHLHFVCYVFARHSVAGAIMDVFFLLIRASIGACVLYDIVTSIL